jgi:mannose-1-phosphate guanylyltransferase
MADHFYALIMAGGVGSRLWPMSRQKSPKQVLPLMGEHSMFAMAVERLRPLLTPEDVLVVVGAEQVNLLKAEGTGIPDRNYVIEPAGRGTAPAIALSAIALRRRDPEAIMAVLTADHFIGDRRDSAKCYRLRVKLPQDLVTGHHAEFTLNRLRLH